VAAFQEGVANDSAGEHMHAKCQVMWYDVSAAFATPSWWAVAAYAADRSI